VTPKRLAWYTRLTSRFVRFCSVTRTAPTCPDPQRANERHGSKQTRPTRYYRPRSPRRPPSSQSLAVYSIQNSGTATEASWKVNTLRYATVATKTPGSAESTSEGESQAQNVQDGITSVAMPPDQPRQSHGRAELGGGSRGFQRVQVNGHSRHEKSRRRRVRLSSAFT
jgi:hypothetical protein